MKKSARIIGLIAALLTLGVVSAGFVYYQVNLKPTHVTSATNGGNFLEDFFPIDSNLFVFIDAQNSEQRETTDLLLDRMGGASSQDYLNQFADNLIKDGTLTTEAATELTKSPRIAIGGALPTFTFGAKKSANTDSKKKKDSDKETTALYVVFETPKAMELVNAINQLPDSRQLNQQQSQTKVFAVASGDVIVFSTDPKEKIESIVNHQIWEKKTFSQSENFVPYVSRFNSRALANAYVKLSPALIIASLQATEAGFGMDSWSLVTEPADAAKKLVSLYSQPHQSLLNVIPTNGLLVFAENFGIATQLSLQPEIGDMLKKTVGLDLEKDIGDSISNFVMQDIGLPIPVVSFYVEGVKDSFIKKLDEQVNKLIVFANYSVKTDPVKGPFVSRESVVNNGITATRISLHPENVADGVALPPFLLQLSNSLKISYGRIQKADLAMTFVSTNPFVVENLADTGLWGVGTTELREYRDQTMKNGGVSYVSVSKMGDVIARMLELIDSAQTRFEAQASPKSSLSKIATELREKLKKIGDLYSVTGTDGEGIVQKIVLKIVK